MNFLKTSTNSRNSFPRFCFLSRGTIVSLLFLVSVCFGYSYIDDILNALSSRTADDSPLFAEESRFTSKNSCYHLLTIDRSSPAGDSTLDLKLLSFYSRNSASLVYPDWGVAGSVEFFNTGITLNRINDSDHEKLRGKSPITTGTLSAWVHSPYGFSLGMSLGNSFSSQLAGDSLVPVSITSPFTTGTAALPITFRAALRYRHRLIHGEYSYYRGLILAAAPKYEMNSGTFRTAPLSLMEQRSLYSGGVHNQSDSITALFSINRHWGTTFIKSENAMPFMPELLTYRWGIRGNWRRLAGDISWSSGSGYIYGYDSPAMISRWVRFDDLFYKRFHSEISYEGKQLGGSLFTELLSGDMRDYGYTDYYPFSSWTIFKPLAFRYSNGLLRYRSWGGSFSAEKRWSEKSRSRISLRAACTDIFMEADRETKKIAVLIPIYTGDTTINYADQKLILGDIHITHSQKVGKSTITAGIKQLIPIPITPEEEEPAADGGTGTGTEGPGTGTGGSTTAEPEEPKWHASGFGGMNITLSVTMPIRGPQR